MAGKQTDTRGSGKAGEDDRVPSHEKRPKKKKEAGRTEVGVGRDASSEPAAWAFGGVVGPVRCPWWSAERGVRWVGWGVSAGRAGAAARWAKC